MGEPDLSGPHPHFGRFLKMRRDQWDIKQREVLAHLPGWTQANYSRLESGVIAPAFDHLLPIYQALGLAGVPWTLADRRQFLELARKRIEGKKTRWERRPDADWAQLRYQLAHTDQLLDEPVTPTQQEHPPRPLLRETRHLVGREGWLSMVIDTIQGRTARKLLILQGPMGVGKSSELHRLATYFIEATKPVYQVLWLPLSTEREHASEACLEMFLGAVLAELGSPSQTPVHAPLEARMTSVLAHLERSPQPVILLLDNAEGVLTEDGVLASCWEYFLARFLSFQHRGTLVLATKEWPGWPGRGRSLVAETVVPPLSVEASVLLLQHLGLESVPVQHLHAVSERVGGIPLCLEWVATLAQDPLLLDDWQGFDLGGEGRDAPQDVTACLLRLLEEPSLLQGHFAAKLQPLLDRILEKRLSIEAKSLLQQLAVASVPLGKSALRVLCQHPRLLKELRDASLLVAFPHRVQLLPMVASAVLQHLTPQQVKEREEILIKALTSWLEERTFSQREQGAVITELVVLLLTHHRLLEAAQLLTCYGWICFQQGHAPHLARLVSEIKERFDWQATEDNSCGGLLLHYLLAPYLGKPINAERRAADHQRIYDALTAGKVVLWPTVDIAVVQDLMMSALNALRFGEAQALLDACTRRLAPVLPAMLDQRVSLLEKQAWVFSRWCEYAEERQERQKAKEMREQAIALYQQCITLLSAEEHRSPLDDTTCKRRLARDCNHLGYHLNRSGRFAEALAFIGQSIALKEQGYVQVGSLAASYGEKAEALAGLGCFGEALAFDEKALEEVERCAEAVHTSSQEEVWIYRVNRGRLYLRLGRVAQAEQLLREALEHIHPRRRMYRMFAQEALAEIEQWRRQATSPGHQLDWRWIGRYRELASYDGHWWLAHGGPFTGEEQHQWDQWYPLRGDETVKERLSQVLVQSRQRELAAAIAEGREPHLHYPAIDIAEVRRRIADLQQLDAEIDREEPNALVRHLYHGTIEEELDFLRLIEATHESDTEAFWNYTRRLDPEPTPQEMEETLSQVKRVLRQGLQRQETREASQRVIQLMREQLHLSLDLSEYETGGQQVPQHEPSSASSRTKRWVRTQVAKRFFEAVLRESGYVGWEVKIDPAASGARVEQGLRLVFLPDTELTVERMRHFIAHELAGHAARCLAGERSPIGLLGIHTKNSLPTEEGLALALDRRAQGLYGRESLEWGTWLGTLATGLASGVVTPPQTFRWLFAFLESLFLLRGLLEGWDDDLQKARERAKRTALSRCLRTYRGVPDLERAGVCYTKDVVYLRGLVQVEGAVAEDETVLDRIAMGVVALELLPELHALGMVAPPQPLRALAADPDLESYIRSFEVAEEDGKPAEQYA